MAYVGIPSPRAPAAVGTLSYANFRRRVAAPSSTITLFLKVLPERVVAKRFNVRRRPIAALIPGVGAGGAVLQDAGATALVVAGAYGLVSTFDNLTRRNIIEQRDDNQFVQNMNEEMSWLNPWHSMQNVFILSTQCLYSKLQFAAVNSFVVIALYLPLSHVSILNFPTLLTEFESETGSYTLWAAFSGVVANFQISTSTGARYFASLVPSINCLRLLIHGLSLVPDEGLIKSVTRQGKPEELLRGPLFYVLVLILCAIVFWRDSPIGMISLAMMCGGDGIADIMGRRFGTLKIPYNQQKSWAGSISMFLFGFLVSICMLYYFSAFGYIKLDGMWTLERVALISLVATVVESLPITETMDDNISVPLASMMAAVLVFGY